MLIIPQSLPPPTKSYHWPIRKPPSTSQAIHASITIVRNPVAPLIAHFFKWPSSIFPCVSKTNIIFVGKFIRINKLGNPFRMEIIFKSFSSKKSASCIAVNSKIAASKAKFLNLGGCSGLASGVWFFRCSGKEKSMFADGASKDSSFVVSWFRDTRCLGFFKMRDGLTWGSRLWLWTCRRPWRAVFARFCLQRSSFSHYGSCSARRRW